MLRKRGLASAASILADLPERSTDPGHIQALRRNSRTFTLADQIDRLVGASEATPDRGFLARTMALCSLPRTNPGDRIRYVRRNGPYTLVMTTAGINKLPPRLQPALDPGVGVYRSGTDPKPRYRSRPVPLRVHAKTRYL